MKIAAQNTMRSALQDGKNSEEVATFMSTNWKPGVTVRDPETAILRAFNDMTPEEREALIERIRQSVA
jgi:hypothetical protein